MHMLCLMQSRNYGKAWSWQSRQFIALLLVHKSSLFIVVLSSFIFCTSGRVLWPGIIVSPLSLPSYRELKRIKRGMCPRVCKIYVNSYTSVVNPLRTYIHTYKHNRRLRPHKHPHDYVPHAKYLPSPPPPSHRRRCHMPWPPWGYRRTQLGSRKSQSPRIPSWLDELRKSPSLASELHRVTFWSMNVINFCCCR